MSWRSTCKILQHPARKKLRLSTICRHIPKPQPLLRTPEIKPNDVPRRGTRGPIRSHILGIDHMKEPHLNKGLGFTLEERQTLGIYGLIPAQIRTQEEEVQVCLAMLKTIENKLDKYIYLGEMLDRNEKIFYKLFSENVETVMPIVYTPTIAVAAQKFCLLFRKPRGLFITINDRGHIYDILQNWPVSTAKIVVVTDGEKILGVGDLGICGILIPVGKNTLYTAFAGVEPAECVPIVLDVGTDNQEYLEDPLYLGLRHKRVAGQLYVEFVDEFMEAVVGRFGQHTVVHYEDFEMTKAFRLLTKYRNRYCTFNDDIQGSGSVTLAGLLVCCRMTGKELADHKILFFGAGQGAVGTADLCVVEMLRQGVRSKDASANIWMMDVDGLLVETRTDLDDHQVVYAKSHPPLNDLLKVVEAIKPSMLIGMSTVGDAFTPEVIRAMASFNEKPVIFALSNPTANAECSPREAYVYSEGRAIYSSGSPFEEVEYGGRTYRPGLGNNAWVFPAIGLSALLCGMHHIPDEVFLVAAGALAEEVTDQDMELGSVYPPLTKIKQSQIRMAAKICQYAYDKGLASVYPEPKDKKAHIDANLYNYCYKSSMTEKWAWPEEQPRK